MRFFGTFRGVSRYAECLENCIFFAKHLLISEKKCTFAAKTRPKKCKKAQQTRQEKCYLIENQYI